MLGTSKSVWGFDPRSVPGCQLWLDAADTSSMTLSGSSVTQWRDKSGSLNHFTPTSGTPTSILDNGRNVVNFTSGAIMTSTNQITFTTSSAFFIVSRLNLVNASNTGMLLVFTDIGGGDFSIRFFGPTVILGGTSGSGNSNDLANGAYYVNGTFNPSFGSSTYLNTYSLIGTVAPLLGGTSYLAFSSAFISRFFIGNIAEFLYYPGGVTSSQRQQIEGYLAHKWGLTTPIPSIHPFSSIRPHLRTFQPKDIPGCQLWLDAADSSVVTTATGVSQWRDKSGNAYNLTQSTTGSQPSYSSSLITFSNNTHLNIPQAAVNNLSTWSLFFVINPISSSNYIMVKQKDGQNTYNVLSMTYNTNSGGQGQTGSTGFLYWRSFNAGTQLASTAALSTSTLQFCNLTYDGTNLYFYKNGELEKTTAGSFTIPNDTSATNYTMGIWIQDGTIINSGVTNFRLGEMLVYNTGLTISQRQTIEGYLAHKWGLTTPIPSTHPFKSFPPASLHTVIPTSVRLINLGASGGGTSGSFTMNSIVGGGTGTFTNSATYGGSSGVWGMAQCFDGARSDYDLYMVENPNFMELVFPRELMVTKIFLVPRNQQDSFPSSLTLKADGTLVGTYTSTTVSQALGMGISYSGTGFYIQPATKGTTWRFDFTSSPVSFGEIEFWGYLPS